MGLHRLQGQCIGPCPAHAAISDSSSSSTRWVLKILGRQTEEGRWKFRFFSKKAETTSLERAVHHYSPIIYQKWFMESSCKKENQKFIGTKFIPSNSRLTISAKHPLPRFSPPARLQLKNAGHSGVPWPFLDRVKIYELHLFWSTMLLQFHMFIHHPRVN